MRGTYYMLHVYVGIIRTKLSEYPQTPLAQRCPGNHGRTVSILSIAYTTQVLLHEVIYLITSQ